jgi:hypothetical protein
MTAMPGCGEGGPLHVVEVPEGSGDVLIAMIAAIGRELGLRAGEGPRVFVVGPERTAARAVLEGCRLMGRFCPPLRSPLLATRSLRAAIDAAGTGDGLVVWGSPVLAGLVHGLRRSAGGRLEWVVTGTIGPMPSWVLRRVRGLRATVLSESLVAPLGRILTGVSLESVQPWIGRASPLANVSPSTLSRESLRAEWDADDDVLVVGLAGPEPAWTDYRRAADVAGIAAVRGTRVRLIGHPDTARAWRTQRWMEEVGLARNPLLVDERISRPWEVLAGLDVGLALGDGVRTAGAEAGGRRWSTLTSRGAGQATVMATPSIGALWFARSGLPVLVEEGAIDPELVGAEGDARFAVDDPLRATREVILFAKDRAACSAAGGRAKAAVDATVLPTCWGRIYGSANDVASPMRTPVMVA